MKVNQTDQSSMRPVLARYILDGSRVRDRSSFYQLLKDQFESEEFIGSNLDAFYDVASTSRYPWTLLIQDDDCVRLTLGEAYWERFTHTCKDLMRERPDVLILLGHEGNCYGYETGQQK